MTLNRPRLVKNPFSAATTETQRGHSLSVVAFCACVSLEHKSLALLFQKNPDVRVQAPATTSGAFFLSRKEFENKIWSKEKKRQRKKSHVRAVNEYCVWVEGKRGLTTCTAEPSWELKQRQESRGGGSQVDRQRSSFHREQKGQNSQF